MARLKTGPTTAKKTSVSSESVTTVALFDAKFKPKPPNGLNKWTKAAFNELVETLREEKRLFKRDLPVILQYAAEQGTFLQLLEKTQKPAYKPVFMRQGGFAISPELQVMNRAADNARQILSTYFRIGHSVRSVKEVDTAGGDQAITQTNRTPEQSRKDWILGAKRA